MKFKFYIDRKVSGWQRDHYELEAENYEEAVSKMMEEFDEQEFPDESFNETSELYETYEDMTPEENFNFATKELYYKDEIIKDNAIKAIPN